MVVVELHLEHRVGQGLGDLALHLDLLFLCPCGRGRVARVLRPRTVAFPGPSARNERTASCRSSVSNSPANCSGVTSSARSIPPSRDRRARSASSPRGPCVGPAARRCGEPHPLLVHGAVGDDAVDHAPALERLGVVEAAGHHELARPRRTGALGHPLRAAGAGGEPDDGLDEAELRRLLGPDHVAAERDLEPRGQAEPVDRARVGISSASSRCTPSISGPAIPLAASRAGVDDRAGRR